MKLSVVIPALDEEQGISATLAALQPARRLGHEVVLVDGGSADRTRERARPLVDRLLDSPAGRAGQMNRGAAEACGDGLLFLHADTLVPENFVAAITGAFRAGAGWGRFDLRLDGAPRVLRLVETMINLRSRLSGIATGDQGIFVRRDLFEDVGGYASLPLMEDIELSRRLKRRGPPACLRERVITSSRRWEQQGIARTILLMWWLRARYALGVDPARLARAYRRHGG
ncbi:MAG: TIGR04283 family arsenosugar biosynthesis glycosyltransferase [Acidobacteriota bacterium]|nr:TIGR04283 family arsenosugar biosynthesis glycosyltransferase [Acidobacteriota bacterium]